MCCVCFQGRVETALLADYIHIKVRVGLNLLYGWEPGTISGGVHTERTGTLRNMEAFLAKKKTKESISKWPV